MAAAGLASSQLAAACARSAIAAGGDYFQQNRRRGGPQPGAAALAGEFPLASKPARTAGGSGARRPEFHRRKELGRGREGFFDKPQESRTVKRAQWEVNVAQHILVF